MISNSSRYKTNTWMYKAALHHVSNTESFYVILAELENTRVNILTKTHFQFPPSPRDFERFPFIEFISGGLFM